MARARATKSESARNEAHKEAGSLKRSRGQGAARGGALYVCPDVRVVQLSSRRCVEIGRAREAWSARCSPPPVAKALLCVLLCR